MRPAPVSMGISRIPIGPEGSARGGRQSLSFWDQLVEGLESIGDTIAE